MKSKSEKKKMKSGGSEAKGKFNPSDAGLKSLNLLVGAWNLSGDAKGRIQYEWAKGGFFLLQHVDLEYGGKKIQGLEVIGRQHRVGEEPSKEIKSRFYSFLDGLTLDYVYQLAGNRLTIWFGPKGSDNRFEGTIAPDGNSYSGAWEWPGGGYKVTGARVK